MSLSAVTVIVPSRQLRALLSGVLLAFLAVSTFAIAQVAAPSFDDIVGQANAAREQNDVATAINLYSQAVELKPEWPDGWWFLGLLHYGNQDYSEAADALSHFAELSPSAGPAFALRGLSEFQLGEYPQSLQDIQHGLALGAATDARNEAVLRYHEAQLLTLSGDFEEALSSYAFFTRQEVTNPEMLIAIGLAGLRTQLLPKNVDPGQRELFLAAGTAAFHFMAGDDAKAKQEFAALFQRFPSAVNAHYLYGYMLFAKDPDQALPEFTRELEIAPANAAANTMEAWGLLLQNDPAEALPYAQKAVAATPGAPAAQLVLGRSLLETGNLDDAMTHLQEGLKLDPNNLEIHLALVKAYSKAGRKEDAQRERLLSLSMAKGDPTTDAHP